MQHNGSENAMRVKRLIHQPLLLKVFHHPQSFHLASSTPKLFQTGYQQISRCSRILLGIFYYFYPCCCRTVPLLSQYGTDLLCMVNFILCKTAVYLKVRRALFYKQRWSPQNTKRESVTTKISNKYI